MANPRFTYFCFALLIISYTSGSAVNLIAENAAAELPIPMHSIQVSYDRNYAIYIFGGRDTNGNIRNQILRYDIGLDSIQGVATMPSSGLFGLGSVQYVDQSFYSFRGADGVASDDVVKFDPQRNVADRVAKLPMSAPFHTSFKKAPDSSTIYFLFENLEESRFDVCDLSTYTNTTNVATINGFYRYTSIVQDNFAYILGNNKTTKQREVVRFDMTTFAHETVSTDFPAFTEHSRADDTNAYRIGGYQSDSGVDTDYLFKFNLVTYDWTTLDVVNFPVYDGFYYVIPPAGACEHVEQNLLLPGLYG